MADEKKKEENSEERSARRKAERKEEVEKRARASLPEDLRDATVAALKKRLKTENSEIVTLNDEMRKKSRTIKTIQAVLACSGQKCKHEKTTRVGDTRRHKCDGCGEVLKIIGR